MLEKRTFTILLVFLMLFTVLAGCDNNGNSNSEQNNSSDIGTNPFEENNQNSPVKRVGGFGFGPAEKPENQTFTYNGGTMEIPFYIQGQQEATEVGFSLFLDGIIQPYQIKDDTGILSAEQSYMQTFEIEANTKKEFTIVFTPVTGKAGDSLGVFFAGMLMPSYQPENETQTGYGVYHKMSSPIPYTLKMNADSETQDGFASFEATQTEPITQEFLKEFSYEDGTNALDEQPMFELHCSNDSDTEKLIAENGKLKLTLKAFGGDSAQYRTTVFINHQPVQIMGKDNLQFDLQKGNISTCEFELDISEFDRINTIYAVSVPIGSDYMKTNVRIDKIQSLLLINDKKEASKP